LGGIIFLALMALVSWPIGAATATSDPKNGWGEATSEEAGEEKEGKESIGDHASDPNNDGPGNDEREGLGNTADALTDQKNPDKLGDLLDSIDGDDCDDTNPPSEC
jgi:hypothetical protein